ncbi:glycosyltransferase family 2 protein [uncultured Salinisphaera sp.]|uniref:glycosyltransferase family 2 protein n=1 Tax=uncultured Salinisphaera sp. TaxID=359372 RepID=UPI0032B1CC40
MANIQTPSIGIVITTFNAATCIRRAVESICYQLAAVDELIIVDDGSTDETVSELKLLCENQPNIRLIEMPRVGRAGALNIGVAACSADVVAIQDADDYSLPDRCSAIRNVFASDTSDVVAFSYYAKDEATDETWLRHPPKCHEQLVKKLANGVPICHTAAAFRREVWRVVGGYPTNTPMIVDLPFWIGAAKAGFRFAGSSVPVAVHHYHPRSNFTANFNRVARARVLLSHNFAAYLAFGRPGREFSVALVRFVSILLPRKVRDGARVAYTRNKDT